MKHGVNNNGIEWFYDDENNEYHCIYYMAENIELSKDFKNVSIEFIGRLTFEDLQT